MSSVLISQLLSNNLFRAAVLLGLVAIVVDTISGVALAVRAGKFQLKLLADYLGVNFMPYLGLVIATVAATGMDFKAVGVGLASSAAYLTFVGAQTHSIIDNVSRLLNVSPAVVAPVVQGFEHQLAPTVPTATPTTASAATLSNISDFQPVSQGVEKPASVANATISTPAAPTAPVSSTPPAA